MCCSAENLNSYHLQRDPRSVGEESSIPDLHVREVGIKTLHGVGPALLGTQVASYDTIPAYSIWKHFYSKFFFLATVSSPTSSRETPSRLSSRLSELNANLSPAWGTVEIVFINHCIILIASPKDKYSLQKFKMSELAVIVSRGRKGGHLLRLSCRF